MTKRCAPEDAPELARLLHQFNAEYGEQSPSVDVLTGRLAEMIAAGELACLLAGDPPVGVAVVRMRRSIWYTGLEAYLAELYVEPDSRGKGLGRGLLDAVIEQARTAGAKVIDLNTSVDDRAARALYESVGFTNRESSPEGPSMLYYELEL